MFYNHNGEEVTMMEKVLLRKAAIPLIIFLFITLLLIWNASGAFASPIDVAAKARHAEFSSRNEIPKIMSVLESRTPDKKVLEKAADKMSDMNERNLRLMSSLCDRISATAGTSAADLAYSLLTALIVLS